MHDDFLGFHLAQDYELREIGLFYYVLASSEILADALHRAERYSGIMNEGILLQARIGKETAIALSYVGIDRRSDRHQIEFWLTSLVRFHAVSSGTYRVAFFIGFHPIDLVYSLVKGVVIFMVVLAVALFYGYRVRGGPVEVGEAAARSMRVNLVLIALLNGITSLILWGFKPPFPIA